MNGFDPDFLPKLILERFQNFRSRFVGRALRPTCRGLTPTYMAIAATLQLKPLKAEFIFALFAGRMPRLVVGGVPSPRWFQQAQPMPRGVRALRLHQQQQRFFSVGA